MIQIRFALFFLLVAPMGSARAESQRPNVLFILVDDLGWKDPSYMGSDFFETPHLDRLAREGMVFTDAYACAANCAPARACLLSGQYTPRHQIFNVGLRPRGKSAYRKLLHVPGTDVLDPKITTWAQAIGQSGYTTATIGKWHLSHDPLPYGFDVNIGGTHSGSPPQGYYPPHTDEPILGVDFFPTFCSMTSAEMPRNQPRDGVDLLPFLKGEVKTLGERALFWHFPAYLEGTRQPLESRDPLFRTRPCSIIRKGEWKLHEYFEDGGIELYQLTHDLGEQENLAQSKPEKARELLAELRNWREQLDAPIPTQANPDYDAQAEAVAISKSLQAAKHN